MPENPPASHCCQVKTSGESQTERPAVSAARKVFPGYGVTTVPECKNIIFALLRKHFDLLSVFMNHFSIPDFPFGTHPLFSRQKCPASPFTKKGLTVSKMK
jgi:hypothetical protein